MEYKVYISERAEINLDNICNYLLCNWSQKVKEDFIIKFQKIIKILQSNPRIFPESQLKKEIRRCIITKHNALYYRIQNDKVEIITIQDTRKDIESHNI